MKKSTRTRKAVILVNTFAAAGYVLLHAAYAFFIGAIAWLLMFSAIGAKPYDTIIATAAPESTSSAGVGTYVALSAALILVMALLVLLAYLIGKWSAHILRHFMHTFSISRTHRNLFLAKGGLATIPLIGFIWINVFYLGTDAAIPVLHAATILMALAAIIVFALELFVAKSLAVNPRDSW